MKREWLKGLDLTDEQIDKIMAENGKDIENAKGDLETVKNTLKTTETELDTAKGQLKTANETIQSYKDMDIETIKKSAADYKTKYEESERKGKEQLEDLKFEHSVDNAVSKAGAKNVKSVKALLDVDNLKDSKNIDTDLESQITALKESDPYLFIDANPDGTGGSKGNGGKGGKSSEEKNPWSKEHFNLTEQGRLLREDPEKAKQLMTSAKK